MLITFINTTSIFQFRMRVRPVFNYQGFCQWNWRCLCPENFELGDNTKIGLYTILDALKDMKIEENFKIRLGAKILSYSSINKRRTKIILKKDCCVGTNTVVFPDVTVGEGLMVGAMT
jgi:acetyltransferase-like isoleucine patch superfamily enzyme